MASALPRWMATDRRWRKKSVSRTSAMTPVIRRPSWATNALAWPRPQGLKCEGNKHMRVGEGSVLVNSSCLCFGCRCSRTPRRGLKMALGKRVRRHHVSGQAAIPGPRQSGGAIWPQFTGGDQAGGFLDGWHIYRILFATRAETTT